MSAYEPHPYALLLPALTDDEYAALKADIAEHGILYPVITDDDGRVLDGVHRTRIAAELGIEVPVSQMGQSTDERKMHLAVGLNLRRRHLDADRRRELVRRLHDEENLSLRKLASITGWSKSTIDRDLKTSPFEEALAAAGASGRELRAEIAELGDEKLERAAELFAECSDAFGSVFGWADQQWKRGNWPPPLEEHAEMTFAYFEVGLPMEGIRKMFAASSTEERERIRNHYQTQAELLAEARARWESKSTDERIEWAERKRHLLQPRVPDGTPTAAES